MKCPHCTTGIRFEEADDVPFYEYSDHEKSRHPGSNGYDIPHGFCPECNGLIVMLRIGRFGGQYGRDLLQAGRIDILYPKFSSRPVESEVPPTYRQDFEEAAAVLPISPKASAAISRRLLQHILRDELGVKPLSLSVEIEEFISRTDVPSHLTEAVDAVRNVGNFAAHPLKDKSTGAIADVEPGEAEWLLDVLESLFDFAFVQPKRLALRKKQLNEKLSGLNKPKMKGS